MSSFWDGFEKAATAEGPEQHHVRRMFLGNPLSSAIEAKKGDKLKSFGKAYMHNAKESLKGMGVGTAGGALAGGAASLLSRGKIKPGHGASLGALGGAYAGGIVGGLKGQHGAEASRIHGEHSKHKKPAEEVKAAGAVVKKEHPQWMIMAAQRAAKKLRAASTASTKAVKK